MDEWMSRRSVWSLFVVPIMAVAVQSVRVTACDCGDPPPHLQNVWTRTFDGRESNIHVSQIVKQFAAFAFHYKTETCPLKVKEVWDEDFCWAPKYQDWCSYHHEYYWVWGWVGDKDYHDHATCHWEGVGVTYGTGHDCVWDMRWLGPTTGEVVTFSTDDFWVLPRNG